MTSTEILTALGNDGVDATCFRKPTAPILIEHTARVGTSFSEAKTSVTAMVHAREPYAGAREMVRVRFDDPNIRTVIIT